MATAPIQERLKGYDHDDPDLKTGTGGLTVWELKKMAEGGRFSELDSLFDNGLSMNALPVGISAGAPFPLLVGRENKLTAEWLDSFTDKSWRGKWYFSSNDKRVTQGRNRVRKSLVFPKSPFVPMMKFTSKLVDSDPLAPRAKSNLVVLTYSDPLTRPYVQELLALKVQFYDVMVAVKGKYGPVFVGKTWLGKYGTTGNFTATDPNKLVARYFLDFNEGALKEQRESHWDGSEEEMLDPLPHFDN
jgi:hypothetical protein